MTESRPRRISLAMIEHAARLLPPERTHWGEAMRSELDHMEGDVEALRWAAGCVFASYFERRRHRMNQQSSSFGAIVRKPSALAPLAMSLAALGVIGIAALFGKLVPEPDEGAFAHIWQLLMAGQLPVLAFFAIKWLPRAPIQTLCVLALQAGAVLAATAPVYFLHL